MTAQSWVYDLHGAIAHGDDEHRAWLLDAILAFSEGCPIPAPRGSFTLRARVDDLTQERDEWVDVATRAVEMLDPMPSAPSPALLLAAVRGAKLANASLREANEQLRAELETLRARERSGS